MKVDKRNPHHWFLLAQQFIYTLLAAAARPFRRKSGKPVVVLYGHQLSGNLNALYQQWLETHQEKMDMYFLSLDPAYSRTLEAEGIQLLRCGRLTDMLKVGRCDAMITDHGLHMMSPLLSLTDVKFIDVWHGIPFKGFVPEDFRLQHRYDEVWVSSALLKRIYVEKFGFQESKVFDLGYARADKLFRGDPPKLSYYAQLGLTEGRKLVLYAPTWQQSHNGHPLFPFGETQHSFLTTVGEACGKNGATLVVRSHLNASIRAHPIDNVVYCSMKDCPDTEALLQDTDLLICDWSSIAFDFLALGRPAIFLDVDFPYKNGYSLGPEFRFGMLAEGMDSLLDCLANSISSQDLYFGERGESHTDITLKVYGRNTDGKAAATQLDRLEMLTVGQN